MAAAKKAFAKLTTAFAAAPRWTLGHFKAHLKEGMDKASGAELTGCRVRAFSATRCGTARVRPQREDGRR